MAEILFACIALVRGLSLRFMGTVPFNLFAQIQSKEALCTLLKKTTRKAKVVHALFTMLLLVLVATQTLSA